MAIHDVPLKPFSGDGDPQGHVIEKESFLPLLEWLETCDFQLETSAIDPALHLQAMLGDLEGAARRAFQRKYMSRKHEIQTWTMA